MAVSIYQIRVGFDDCYIIRDDGVVMIDGGGPKKVEDFRRGLRRISMEPEEIQLMIMTHGHWDHIGSAREIQQITGAKIAMHRRERYRLEDGLKVVPPGVTLWGRVFTKIYSQFLVFSDIPPADVDVVLEDEGISLAEYGVAGKVLYTPGHSPGSVSVLLETGDAFVGDMAMNRFPLRLGPGLPIFAENGRELIPSWRLLLDQGARMIYPAHGDPFPADIIRNVLAEETEDS